MIGRIRGVLAAVAAPDLLVDVGGVGYELQAPMTTIYELPEPGGEVCLHTHFVVREDAQLLYGFQHERERMLFRHLIRVSGVGPKLALAILSGMDAAAFARCVRQQDAGTLVRLPGVGKRTAERVLLEMQNRLGDCAALLDEAPGAAAGGAKDIVAEAESALVALGYKPAEASRAVAAVNDGAAGRSEELIRRALRAMVK